MNNLKIKVITLTQPWATLLAIGAKRIETRSWFTGYRGPLAIHAAKGLSSVGGKRGLYDLCYTHPFIDVLESRLSTTRMIVDFAVPHYDPGSLPLGAIIAICDLVGCVSTEKIVQSGGVCDLPNKDGLARNAWPLTDQEEEFGDYAPGRYGWLLSNVRALPDPVPAKGALGLWDWDGAL